MRYTLSTPLLKQDPQSYVTIELSKLSKQQEKEQTLNKYDDQYNYHTIKIDQILESKNKWKDLIINQKKQQTKSKIINENYFTFPIIKIQDLFDFTYIFASPDPKKTYQSVQDRKEAQLKKQVDKLNQFGGVYGLQNYLRTNIKSGLDDSNYVDLEQRKKYFGVNETPELVISNFNTIFWRQIKKDRLSQFLILVSVFNLIVELERADNYIYDLEIVVLLFLYILYKTYIRQQYNKEIVYHQNDIKNRNRNLYSKCNVIRNGQNTLIESSQLLVGDILCFKQGEFIQCDGILTKVTTQENIQISSPFPNSIDTSYDKGIDNLCQSTILEFDENANTVKCADPFIYAGSQIIQGEGEILVCAVGQQGSDYRYYKQAFVEEFKKEKTQKQYFTTNSMFNPFTHRLESLINKQSLIQIVLISILIIILGFREDFLEYEKLLLYIPLILLLCVPYYLLSQMNLYMIYIIKKCRIKEIYLFDYFALYWLGLTNEIIVDTLDSSVIQFLNAQINVRYFSQNSSEQAICEAKSFGLLQDDYEAHQSCIEGSYVSSLFNDKNRFTFLSRRFVSPTLDYMKIDKLQQNIEMDFLEQQSQKFSFQGVVDQDQLYESLQSIKVLARASFKEKEQFISFLKLYDRVIFMNGQDTDRKALEYAHVSIGPQESRSTIKLFQPKLIRSMIQCVSYGRAVYFALLQLSFVNVCTTLNIVIYALLLSIISDKVYIMHNLTFIIFYCLIYHFTQSTLKNKTQDIQVYVMMRGPYNSQFRIIERSLFFRVFRLLLLFSIEAIACKFYGYLPIAQEIMIGLLFSQHAILLVRPLNQKLIYQIKGIIYGLLLNVLNLVVGNQANYFTIEKMVRYYIIGLFILIINIQLCL